MNDRNPYAAPQADTKATEHYRALSPVELNPDDFRRFSRGAGVLLLLCMPFELLLFFAFEWISVFVLYQLLLHGGYLWMTFIPKEQAGRRFFFAALLTSLLASCFMLYHAISLGMLPDYSRSPPQSIIVFMAVKISAVLLLLIGNLRLGAALGYSGLIHSSRWALGLTLLATSSIAVFTIQLANVAKPRYGLFGLCLFITCGAAMLIFASLYYSWQLRAALTLRLQRQLPDKIEELPPEVPQALDADFAQYHVQ